MGWGNFLKKAAATGLRVAASGATGGFSEKAINVIKGQVDPGILGMLGSKSDMAKMVAKKAIKSSALPLLLGEFIYDAKTLVVLYQEAMQDGKLTIQEAQALMDGLQELVDDIDAVI